MVYTLLAGLIFVLAIVFILLAAKTLFKKQWLFAWIRGMAGLGMAAAALLFVFAALDLYSYKQLGKESLIANLGFTKIAPQRYKVSLVDGRGVEEHYELAGDLWQLDARIIKWNNALSRVGLAPGYRLDRLGGRYYALEEETSSPRTVYSLVEQKGWVDVWQWLRSHNLPWSIVDASYGSATYLPMEDGALFSVSLTHSGLVARPLNDRAKAAVERWQ